MVGIAVLAQQQEIGAVAALPVQNDISPDRDTLRTDDAIRGAIAVFGQHIRAGGVRIGNELVEENKDIFNDIWLKISKK